MTEMPEHLLKRAQTAEVLQLRIHFETVLKVKDNHEYIL